MMINRNNLDLVSLTRKEDSFKLCSGVIRDRRVTHEMMNNKNILDAAEVLLAVNDANYLTSKADILSRALDYGWTPSNVNPDDTSFEVKVTSKRSHQKLDKKGVNLSTIILLE